MPKGEHTPGPYRNEGRVIVMAGCHYAQGSISARMDQAGQAEIIGLLNKGTHFEGLRVALEIVSMELSVSGRPSARTAAACKRIADSAIDKAKGEA